MTNLNPEQFVNQVKERGGASMNLEGRAPRKGFMVSRAGSEVKIPGEATADHVRNFVSQNESTLAKQGHFVGAWTHEGHTYLDVSRNVRKQKKAERYGNQQRQLAMYDVKRGESQPLSALSRFAK